ncbi:hypothetical protein [Streptomyces sp. NPDC056883]|uniref:hypothetical protein n=1 Tax=Streptomyces sp. NPDC056883 TaxID=3345959 RepID=UPI0036C202CB
MSTTAFTARVTDKDGRWHLDILEPDRTVRVTDPQPGPHAEEAGDALFPYHWSDRAALLGYKITGDWTPADGSTEAPCEAAPVAYAARDADGRWSLTVQNAPEGAPAHQALDDEEFSQRDFTEHLRQLGYYTSNVGAVFRLDDGPWTEHTDGRWSTPAHTVASFATHTATVRPVDGRWTLEIAGKTSHLGEDEHPFAPSRASAALILAGYEIPGLEYHRPSTTGPWTLQPGTVYTVPCYPSPRRTG